MDASLPERRTSPAIAFDLGDAQRILARTPDVLAALMSELPAGWEAAAEGTDTFSPNDVLGHLIHGEHTDWIPRARLILESGERRAFEPFDRFGHKAWVERCTTQELLLEFTRLRGESLRTLAGWQLGPADLERRGLHPDFGAVTLRALLATWVVHDLEHVAQVCRVLCKQYADEVGPWKAFLPILTR